MNGQVLFDFMYDQFIWPAHPRTMNEPEPQAGERANVDRPVPVSAPGTSQAEVPSGSLIVLADHREPTHDA